MTPCQRGELRHDEIVRGVPRWLGTANMPTQAASGALSPRPPRVWTKQGLRLDSALPLQSPFRGADAFDVLPMDFNEQVGAYPPGCGARYPEVTVRCSSR
jgi:hypothetical protein